MFMVFMHRQNGFLPFTFQYFTTELKTDDDVIGLICEMISKIFFI